MTASRAHRVHVRAARSELLPKLDPTLIEKDARSSQTEGVAALRRQIRAGRRRRG